VEEWNEIRAPPPPNLEEVTINPRTTALLILDIQNQNCNAERRPRCLASLQKMKKFLENARTRNMLVIYSLTRKAALSDIRKEVSPRGDEPIVKSGPDKFFNTDLKINLKNRDIKTLVLVGTSAHGAVLNTAIAAILRNLRVIVPVDGISATNPYAEQYTVWHLQNAPGCRGQAAITKLDLIKFT
jgi:nicotinamidase-related amidase